MGNSGSSESKAAKGSPNSTSHCSGNDRSGTQVFLNVYNLQRTQRRGATTLNGAMGFGFYHTGVEVLGVEWAYGGNPQAEASQPGIFCHAPRTALPAPQFHEQIPLLVIPNLTQRKVQAVLQEMMPQWMARDYHLLKKNCNHFSEAFVAALATQAGASDTYKFPRYVNRAARFGDVFVPDVIYNSMMKSVPQPPTGTSSGSGSSAPGGPAPQPQHSPPGSCGSPGATGEAAMAQYPLPRTREECARLSVRELKTAMWVNGVDWSGCIEKGDLINAIMSFNEASAKAHR